MKTDNHELSRKESDLFDRIVAILEQARSNVVRAVNSNTVVAYWLIGREIVLEIQQGEQRAEYGERVIEELSSRLTNRYGRGFSVPNLRNFRQFYLMFQDREPEIRYPSGSELRADRKRYLPGSELTGWEQGKSEEGQPLKAFHPNLSWSHYRALMRVDKKSARDFYEAECVAAGWNRRQLERQIHSLFYERLLMSKDRQGMLQEARVEEAGGLKPVDVLKDPYVMEFLYEEHGKVEGDNPTIGLILCSEKNETIARYSVLSESRQLFASRYMMYLPTEEELRRELERERTLIEERAWWKREYRMGQEREEKDEGGRVKDEG